MYVYRFVLSTLAFALAFTRADATGIEVVKVDSVKQPNGSYRDFKKVMRSQPQLLRDIMVAHINANRKLIEKEVKDAVSKSDMIARGITLMDVVFHLGQPTLRLLSTSSFEVNITGNHFYARSTTPTALGRWADPTFEVKFDLRLTVHMSTPSSTNPGFYVQRAILSVPYAKVSPRNVTGGVVTTFTRIANFFHTAATGKDLLKRAADKHLQRDVTRFANMMLGNVNGPIKSLQTQGYINVQITLNPARNLVIVEMRQANRLALRPVGKK